MDPVVTAFIFLWLSSAYADRSKILKTSISPLNHRGDRTKLTQINLVSKKNKVERIWRAKNRTKSCSEDLPSLYHSILKEYIFPGSSLWYQWCFCIHTVCYWRFVLFFPKKKKICCILNPASFCSFHFDSQPRGVAASSVSTPSSLFSFKRRNNWKGDTLFSCKLKIKTQTGSLPGAVSPPTWAYLFFLAETDQQRQ